MSSYVNCLGGRCPHMPFFIGSTCPGGGECPTLVKEVNELERVAWLSSPGFKVNYSY